MANRSYLYAANTLPDDEPAPHRDLGLHGIAEHAYDIPLAYRILVSAETRLTRSVIWQLPEPIALAGRCGPGIRKLDAFLARMAHPSAAAMRREAMSFLAAHAHPDGWFLLECGEIFEMSGEPLDQQAEALHEGMATLDADIETALRELAPVTGKNFWQRVFAPAQKVVEQPLRDLGLGYWSTTLYHAPDVSD